MTRNWLITWSVFIIAGVLLGVSLVYQPWIKTIDSDGIPELIRLHIIANSDSPADQGVKLKVRDAVLAAMTEKFQGSASLDESRQILLANLGEMEAVAQRVLLQEGFTYSVHALHGIYPFPNRTYGDNTFPAGNYEALRLVLGEGVGHNWWCVLYPPLCFVEESQKGDPITSNADLTKKTYEVRFKTLDWMSENPGGRIFIPLALLFGYLFLRRSRRAHRCAPAKR